jgi:SAM-dependent methyltransferase
VALSCLVVAMKRKALTKNFDSSEVQAMSLDLSKYWSDEAKQEYGDAADVHPEVAARLEAESPVRVLDIGCGTGLLGRELRSRWVGLDRSVEQLQQAPRPVAIADALDVPFADETFDAAASLYTLYFFEDPSAVAAEAWRVLRPGGLFVTCAPSRNDSPEIGGLAPRIDDEAFASEDIEELLCERFVDVEINEWHFPFLELRNVELARDYIHHFYYPELTLAEAEEHARALDLPLKLTKIGAWGVGRKPR